MTNRLRTVVFLALGGLLGARTALADPPAPFGERHQVVISATELVGYSHSETRGYQSGFASVDGDKTSTFALTSIPQAAVDFLVIRRLSLGAELSVYRTTVTFVAPTSATPPGQLPFQFGSEQSWGFTFAPRIGGVLTVSRTLALWPQVGPYFSRLSQALVGTGSVTDYGLSLRLPVLLEVAPHVFVSLTPAASVSLGGSSPYGSYTDTRIAAYSLQAGMGVYF
jgi:hypothetical protein